MKAAFHIFILLLFCQNSLAQQFYFTGEVKDEFGRILQNVTITQARSGYLYKTGTLGSFGIISNQQVDTFLFSFSGYCIHKLVAKADTFARICLKQLPPGSAGLRHDKLSSRTLNLGKDEQKQWFVGDETYASLVENRFVTSSSFPKTGISLNVDRASYSNIRRFINVRSTVPTDAVRIEEMLNYFNLNYSEPTGDNLFDIKSRLTNCPWNLENQLLYIHLSAKKLDLELLPPSNLVFLIDVSGSMDMPNRLPLIKSAFKLLVNNLRVKDTVSIVVYGGVTGIMLNAASGAEKEKILKVIDELMPGGSTPGEAGIRLAYQLAQRHFIYKGNNRVILATDGDFNVGLRTEEELDNLITEHKKTGIYLTCLGVGMGNYKDSKIQILAQKGNGNFAYLDNFYEAEKVLFKEFTQTLYAIANDVYLNVDFNPEYVKEYRLIGFDNKMGAIRDSSVVVEGGEIGSGHSMVAAFEIVPTDINLVMAKDSSLKINLSTVQLKYKPLNSNLQKEMLFSNQLSLLPFASIESDYRFYTAVIMFGSLLRSSHFVKSAEWDQISAIAMAAATPDNFLQQEFMNMLLQAKVLYAKEKRKRRKTNE